MHHVNCFGRLDHLKELLEGGLGDGHEARSTCNLALRSKGNAKHQQVQY